MISSFWDSIAILETTNDRNFIFLVYIDLGEMSNYAKFQVCNFNTFGVIEERSITNQALGQPDLIFYLIRSGWPRLRQKVGQVNQGSDKVDWGLS